MRNKKDATNDIYNNELDINIDIFYRSSNILV